MINYIENRNKIFKAIENNSIVILHSGYDQHKSADAVRKYEVNKNFYYLSGICQKDVKLVMVKMGDQQLSWLFIDEIDEVMAKWVGRTLTKDEAKEISKVDAVYYNSQFESMVSSLYQPTRHFAYSAEIAYLDLEVARIPLYNTFALDYAKSLKERYPSVCVKNIYHIIVDARMSKSEGEIEEIKKSIETTKNAIYYVMKHHNELDNESLATAYHDFTLIHEGKPNSFENIIASGKNATILHYDSNNSPIEENSLLLMDVGCYTNWYSSDISRTFPVSGKFTPKQKEIYEIVLETNKKCIEFAKAGITWKEINDYAKSLLANGLKKMGLIKEDAELIKYYFHSIGHSLGLDVHDPSIYAKGLVEGMVITIEPGLYIEELGIGIRIEDNIVITKDKAIVLSKDIVKEIEDIEKLMA